MVIVISFVIASCFLKKSWGHYNSLLSFFYGNHFSNKISLRPTSRSHPGYEGNETNHFSPTSSTTRALHHCPNSSSACTPCPITISVAMIIREGSQCHKIHREYKSNVSSSIFQNSQAIWPRRGDLLIRAMLAREIVHRVGGSFWVALG